MNRRIILLNVLLGALLIWLGLQLRTHWLDSEAWKAAALARAAQPQSVPVPAPVPAVKPANAADYLEVAQKMLFAKDRDPNAIPEPTPQAPPPPPPPPEPPVPTMPKYFGQMAFGNPTVIMSTEKTPQKSYRRGDKVGEFTIAEFDRDTITLEWNGKTFQKDLKELVPKEAERPVQQAAAPVAAAPPPQAAKPAANQPKLNPVFGVQNGIYRMCAPGDSSPSGAVVDGYRKVVAQGVFGPVCQWEPER